MWTYSQSTGSLVSESGTLIAQGYSGSKEGKNVPGMSNVPDVGPIPAGLYTIGVPFDSATHGPFAIPLSPDPANEMFGRSGFLCHGDSITDPGTASEGCIILPRFARERIVESGDTTLKVVASL